MSADETMVNAVPVILSGGSGTRLWPLSREQYPKQFLSLLGGDTMLQRTVGRLEGLDTAAPIVVCTEAHRFLVAQQLQTINIKPNSIILEPVGRNTAPAIAVAALVAEPDDVLIVLPADHHIPDVRAFQVQLKLAIQVACEGQFVTFGIQPDAPETGYGYIHAGQNHATAGRLVDQFVEKPDHQTAETYLESGDYYWNSGMFVVTASHYLKTLGEHEPEMLACCELAVGSAARDVDFVRLGEEAYRRCPSNSIDYAVMEKTRGVVVIPLDAGWSDVGSWASLWKLGNKDMADNAAPENVVAHKSNRNYVSSEDKLVVLLGVDDLVVVDTDDALLIANKANMKDIKTVVQGLEQSGRNETSFHRKVHRPWGTYDTIDAEDGFQVKRITIMPGASISLQLHHHRAEHWVVVEGRAEVTCGEKVYFVEKNQSTYIPKGEKHRLRNPGITALKLIEVQSGDYLGEDDIVRFEDNYGRD